MTKKRSSEFFRDKNVTFFDKILKKVVEKFFGQMCSDEFFLKHALAARMKETYENMALLLDHIQYNKYNWNICGDLKVVALLLGLQLGYTKLHLRMGQPC